MRASTETHSVLLRTAQLMGLVQSDPLLRFRLDQNHTHLEGTAYLFQNNEQSIHSGKAYNDMPY